MGVEVCAEAAWDSLGEASKRWRVKRRGVEADPRHDPQCRKLTRVQALPSPSSGPTKRTTPTATAKSGRNFGNTYEDRCELQKYRDSEAGAERDSEGCECKVLAGPAQASNLQKRQRRRRHRGSLSNEALVGKLKGSIPKLVLLPQSVSWCLTQECGSVNAANHRYCGRISNSVEDGVADDTLEADAGGLLPAPHQPCDEAAQNRTSSTNVIGVCGISVGEGNPATISNTITTTNTTTTNNSGGWSSDGSFRDCSGSSRHTCGVGAALDVGCCGNNNDGSSWELRRHFPPDALIPRSPPKSIFPVTPDSATTTTVHKTPPQIPPTSPILSKEVPATDSIAPQPNTPIAWKKMSGSGVFRTTPSRRRPRAGERARAGPHAVSTGLRDLRLTWTGGPSNMTSEMKSAGVFSVPGSFSGTAHRPGATEAVGEGRSAMAQHGDGGSLESTMKTLRTRMPPGWGAPRGTVDGKVVVGLTAEVIKSPGVALDRSGRVTVVDKHMLAFDEVWPADLPALRPLRINLRRSCGALPRHGRHGKGKGQDRGGVTGFEGEGHRGPVFLMPMHREGKGVEGREDELFAEPPKLKRVDDETARNRDRYCFRDESRYGALSAEKSTKDRHSGDSSVERKWARCRLWETGVETWRWEWSPEARMMLGRLALWKGALLVSHTHAFVTVFGLGMAGRVVVEGAPHPRGLLFEAYVPASCETCQLHVSVDDLKRLFWDDPQKMWVGKKGDMVVELVKMLYFEYTLETEVADSSAPDGIRLKAHRYSDREPWACLRDYRASDYDLHWESRRSTPARGGGEGPTRVSAINTQIAQVDGHLMDSDEARTGMTIRSAEGSDVGAETISPVDPASIEGPFAGGPGARTPLTEAASASVAGSHSVSSIPNERAVWVSQRLCIRSTQNLVDIDVEGDAMPHVLGEGGDYGAALPGAGSPHLVQPTETEEKGSKIGQRCRSKSVRDSSSTATPVARRGQRMGRNDHSPLTRAGTRAAIGPMGTKTKVRVKAFDMRVEEYKAQRRQAEEEKEARLRAWLAIKKRFRGLTLGTAVRVSGRLLALMVYEFPDQPGNLRVMFADAQSSETFRVSLGIGPVAALARHLSIAPSPENWTLGQRRRLIKNIIRERSAIVPVEEEEVDGSGHPGKAGARTHRRAIGQSLYCMVRCLGRESTASYVPAARTAAPGFARRRNAHQLQQPSPKDHRCLFPAVADRSEPIPLTFNSHEPQQATYAPLMEEAVREGAGTSVAAERGHDGVAAKNPPSKAARSAMGLVANCDPTDACSGLGRLRRLRPRRECGRGRRLCGGVARILGTPGLFSLLRGNWAGAEQEFVLEWYHPSGFRPSGCGPVEAHTTFSLRLLTQDLYLFTEGLDLMATAENWEPGGADTPIGDTPPPGKSEIEPISHASTSGSEQSTGAATSPTPATSTAVSALPKHRAQQDRHSGAEIAGGKASPSSSHSERFGKARALGRGNEKEEPACTRTPLLTESEAWERVAREVFRRCFWKRTWFMTADDGRDQRLPHHRSPAGSAPNSLTLEEYVMSQASRTKPSGMESMIQEPPSAETEARVPSNVQLAIGTCVFRRVIKVAGLGVPPKYLLVIVSQLHDAFVVKCYDFVSGAIRQAERPDPDRDAALLLEFQNMSRLERDIQLQVMLDELLVYEDTAHAAEDSGSHWSVKFVQDADAPIVIDAGSNMYDQQVEEQMAAAAALVDKRREDMQRVQQAAREKDRRARERKNKRDEKRREAQAKSRKKKRESKRRGRTTRRGDDAQGTASEDTSEDSQGSDG